MDDFVTISKSVLSTPLDPQPLICRMKAFDALSQPFRYELELVTEEAEIDPAVLLGKAITLSLSGEKDSVRHYNGYVVEFRKAINRRDQRTRRAVYHCALRPWLWLLGMRTNCRIFRDSSVVDILQAICSDHGFSHLIQNALTQSYPAREYCVQYNESDLAFVSRLLESEGIYYYFSHTESEHQLVLVDNPDHHQLRAENTDIPDRAWDGSHRHYVDTWNETSNLRPSACSLDDYDYLMPTKQIEVKLKTAEPHAYPKGTVFEYPGGYVDPDAVGQKYVEYLLHAQNARAAYVSGTASALGLASGHTFTTPWSTEEHLVVRAESEYLFSGFEAEDPMPKLQPLETTFAELTCSFTAVAKKTPFRPERLTRSPVIAGVQTAKVVGLDATAAEGSIHTDEHGRVMVEFHWADSAGATTDAAAKRSCWIRVAQAWAGNAWGMQFIPRVGHEVVVSFEGGDPDRPLIVGSVYNGLLRAPFPLPDASVSGLKTDRAVNGGVSEAEPNMLSFDDGKGKISMTSQEIGIDAKGAVGIQAGTTVSIDGGTTVGINGGVSKVEVGGFQQSIVLCCPMDLTLLTPFAKIQLGRTGIELTGMVRVNGLPYPVPSNQLAAALTPLVGIEAAKTMGIDTVLQAAGQ